MDYKVSILQSESHFPTIAANKILHLLFHLIFLDGGGALVAGQRVGVDSGLGVQPTGAVDLGSQLNFGNNNNPLYPGGQFGAFLNNIKSFFQGMCKFY